MERETGIEPATNSLEGCDSTTELLPRILFAFSFLLQLAMMAPRSHREHRYNRQRSETKSRIVQRRPRQNHQQGESAHRQPQPLHSKSWCTGEDSNLRSPLGAADLQSAAINHSATCAHRAEQIVSPGSAFSAIKEPLSSHGTSKRLQRPRTPALAQNRFLEATVVSSLGEFCDLPGLLLAVLHARRAQR
jgi:hypothetical protein